uniref:Low density lipoprotein receptor class A domain containing 1 n=1 Tax=Anas platyrhynchos TaxID=8839 RepID=A0A8B9TMP9_ANAPL
PPRCVCVTSLLLLAATVAIVGLKTASLAFPSANRLCAASNNRTGFLCDDRVTYGEDEQEELCGDLPRSLPPYLVFRCGNPAHWVYADKRCNGINDCGDCSDEIGSCKSCPACPPCGSAWWSCSPVFHEYCACVPRSLCRDSVQHCTSWSDEYLCTP